MVIRPPRGPVLRHPCGTERRGQAMQATDRPAGAAASPAGRRRRPGFSRGAALANPVPALLVGIGLAWLTLAEKRPRRGAGGRTADAQPRPSWREPDATGLPGHRAES